MAAAVFAEVHRLLDDRWDAEVARRLDARGMRPGLGKRLQANLRAVKDEVRKRMHRPIAEQGQYLRAVVTGHGRYFAVPCNRARVQVFRFQVDRLWHRTLCRRGQAKHLS